MKNKLFITFIFGCFIQLISTAQENVIFIKYKSIYYADSTNEYLNWYYPNRQVHLMKQHYNPSDGYLAKIGDNFKYTTDTTVDYQLYLMQKDEMEQSFSKVIPRTHFREYTSDVLKYTDHIYYKKQNKHSITYCVTDTLHPMSNWEVLGDTIKLLGFTCYKAITNFRGTNYIAYFTTEIPYPAGPRNFRGLPGLILDVRTENGKSGYTAVEIISPYKGIVPTFNTTAQPISKKEFEKLIEEENKSRMAGIGNFKTN
jgi:GLPGLI family protein